jgi:divalent metal cation (Fe/Co/Zn/Cd) transporter
MSDESTRTVLVALGAGLGVALAKVGAAVVTGSAAMAAEAAHSLADTGNDLSLFIAQRRSSRPPDDQHPLGYGQGSGVFRSYPALSGMWLTGGNRTVDGRGHAA